MRSQSAMSVGPTRVMTSGAGLAIALLVVFIAQNVTSQPYVQPNVRTARPLSHLETATSQPSSQSRRENFEWNARRVGNKKVATISIRKDEERDRRSVPLGDVRVPFHKPPSAGGAEGAEKPSHAHRHHHGDDQWGPEGRRGGEGGGKRRGEEDEEEDYVDDERIGEGWAGRGGVDAPPRHLVARTGALQQLQEEVSEEEDEEEEEEEDEEDEEGDDEGRPTSLEASSRFHELLYATGLRADSHVFSNATDAQEQDDGRARKRRKRGKRGKKVKRDRKRRGKDGKKKKKKKKKKKSKKCRKLKGKLKKQCRKNEELFSFITRSITMSGSEACQYHNLEECYKKVGLVADDRSVVKCRYREEFLECMEEQREGVCDPNFQTEGDMVALRNRIRDEIWTTNSCLISGVVEG